jgi:23S rRNA (guanosine2251-2'-O)-methyltransferase
MTKQSLRLAGIHTISTILHQSPERILNLYVVQGRVDYRIQSLITDAKKNGIFIQTVSRHQLDEWFENFPHQGVAANCRNLPAMTENDLDAILSDNSQQALFLILDGIQDPHNLGACLRTANAAGVHAVIAPKDRSVGLNATVSKVACGAAEVTPFIQVTNLARTIRLLRDKGVWIWGLTGDADKNLFQADLRSSCAFVIGAEEIGLRRLTREHCDELFAIPMHGTVESLNASVATGICLYEAVRQRFKSPF